MSFHNILESFSRHEQGLSKELIDRLSRIDIFPGSLAEYNALRGRRHEIIDTESSEKYIKIGAKYGDAARTFETLLGNGLVGLIRYSELSIGYSSYAIGVPVRYARGRFRSTLERMRRYLAD